MLVSSLAFLASCGTPSHEQEVARISGRITVEGQPLKHGRITFSPATGRAATGVIQEDGSYQLSTYGKHDGAILGMHRIAITAHTNRDEVNASLESDRPVKLKSLIPKRYAAGGTSGLTFEVKSGGSDNVDFDLSDR
ncbi:MAG: hypothetical protein MI725_07680 [Pirellulales bacterium]|nr:hypothetical protein [Pirellulales bacterium]